MIDDGSPTPVTPRELEPEERVFVDLVDDVLRSAPGLVHHQVRTEAGLSGSDPSVYAVFLVETNPAHDLAVTIALAERELRVIVNGRRFARKRPRTRTIERWIDHCCRLVERLTAPDMRLEHDTFAGAPVASRLQTRERRRWRTLLTQDEGWGGVMSMVVPWGFALTQTRQTEYPAWFAVNEHAGDGVDETQEPPEPSA